jgi:ribonuclease HI
VPIVFNQLAKTVMAILWALRWIEETRPKEVIICSDPAASLEALRGGGSKARPDIITDILTVFFRIGFRSNITFYLVPGYAGVGGNEQVAQIAKQSSSRV